MKNFTYSLRFCVQPSFFEEEKLFNLINFCKKAKIDDVIMFINPEELYQGHLNRTQTEVWINTIEKFAKEIKKAGMTYSLNPWSTLGPADRGRVLQKELEFSLMTDKNGKISTAIACPLCEKFKKYLADMYSFMATTKPNIIWIEDDFRLHNHSPLDWGGCFCDLHMEEYSKRLGYQISREKFVEELLKPGEINDCRKIWLDVSRDSLIDLANDLKLAVQSISPNTTIGIMSSIPSVHCAEGRSWEKLIESIEINESTANRPHMPAYSNRVPGEYMFDFNTTTLCTVVNLPEKTKVYPELESFPHTLYSKSKKFTEFQLANSIILDSDGITLNIFDMMGNGVEFESGYEDVLSETKEFLTKANNLGYKISDMEGVKVLFDEKSTYTLLTKVGKKMNELYPTDVWIAGALGAFSIPVSYSTTPSIFNKVIAVSGQYFRNLSEKEIYDMLQNNRIILDGDAIDTLCKLGFNEYLGIDKCEMVPTETNYVTMEQGVDNKNFGFSYNKRMTMQGAVGSFAKIQYKKQPHIITKALNSCGDEIISGTVIINENILLIPFGCFSNETYALFFESRSLFNPIRQQIIQKFINLTENIPMIKRAPFVYLYHYKNGENEKIIVVNSSQDCYTDLAIDYSSKKEWKYIKQNDSNIISINNSNEQLIIKGKLISMETIIIYT